MTDLTNYSENELSLIVFNDEYLYNRRNRSNLKHLLKEMYTFTDDQWEVLKQDIEDDERE